MKKTKQINKHQTGAPAFTPGQLDPSKLESALADHREYMRNHPCAIGEGGCMNSGQHFQPVGLKFYSQSMHREMMLVTEGNFAGWIAYKHPDGGWVTQRKATPEDLKEIEIAKSKSVSGNVMLRSLFGRHDDIISMAVTLLERCVTDAERKEMLDSITGGFCLGCGKVLRGEICHCQNDE